MTHASDKATGPAWWQTQLVAIQEKQAAYLRQHLPALRATHEDLISDTVVALTRQITNNPSQYPSSWFTPKGPETESEESYLYKLATVILKRRIADLFRKFNRERKHSSIDDDPSYFVTDPKAPSLDHAILVARILRVTLLVLDEMPVKDRDLIALTANKDVHTAVNPRDRKRLERIRKKLKDKISRRLGADVEDLLVTL